MSTGRTNVGPTQHMLRAVARPVDIQGTACSDPPLEVGFSVLGPLQFTSGRRSLTPTAPKLRTTLALLLIRRGRLVRTSELIDELWVVDPPRSAMATLHTYIYKIRRHLEDCDGEVGLRTEPYGYIVDVPEAAIDMDRFQCLAERAFAALEAGEPERAADLCRRALELWKGPVLADVDQGPLLAAAAIRLEESWRCVMEARIEADLQLGGHPMLVSELKEMTYMFPVNEEFCRQLMHALSLANRRGEALEAFRRLRKAMADELGLEPSARVQAIHRAILLGKPVVEQGDSVAS